MMIFALGMAAGIALTLSLLVTFVILNSGD